MGITQRRILGPVNPSDDNQPANAVDGDDDSLSGRQAYVAPLSVTSDQSSAQTEAERGGLETSFREAQARAGKFLDEGAEGVAL